MHGCLLSGCCSLCKGDARSQHSADCGILRRVKHGAVRKHLEVLHHDGTGHLSICTAQSNNRESQSEWNSNLHRGVLGAAFAAALVAGCVGRLMCCGPFHCCCYNHQHVCCGRKHCHNAPPLQRQSWCRSSCRCRSHWSCSRHLCCFCYRWSCCSAVDDIRSLQHTVKALILIALPLLLCFAAVPCP